MSRRWICLMTCGAAIAIALGAPAQTAEPGVIHNLNSISHTTLSVLLIFGTGLVASVCWGIGWIVSCSRTNRQATSDWSRELALLETRVASLEKGIARERG